MSGQHTQGRLDIQRGQVWRANNTRRKVRERAIVSVDGDYVVTCSLNKNDKRQSKVMISMFGVGNKNGWTIVEGMTCDLLPEITQGELPKKGVAWGDRSTPILCEAIRRGMRLTSDGKVILQSGRIAGDGKPCKEGYRLLGLSVDGQRCTVSVARVVCLLAHGDPPTPDHVADHIDGNKLNDHPSNLRWATRSENIRNSHHARRHTDLPIYVDVAAKLAAASALLAKVVQLHEAENIAMCHNDEPLISCEFYEEIDRIRDFLKEGK